MIRPLFCRFLVSGFFGFVFFERDRGGEREGERERGRGKKGMGKGVEEGRKGRKGGMLNFSEILTRHPRTVVVCTFPPDLFFLFFFFRRGWGGGAWIGYREMICVVWIGLGWVGYRERI